MPNALAKLLPISGPEYLGAIQEGDPAAAQQLYTMYAVQIRRFLQKHTGLQNVEDAVFDVLVVALRSVRELESPTFEELSQIVRDLSQQGVFALRRNRFAPAAGDRELVGGILTVLDRREREILLRSFLLSENDEEISTELKLPILQIRRTRAKARVLYRISSQCGYENASAAGA